MFFGYVSSSSDTELTFQHAEHIDISVVLTLEASLCRLNLSAWRWEFIAFLQSAPCDMAVVKCLGENHLRDGNFNVKRICWVQLSNFSISVYAFDPYTHFSRQCILKTQTKQKYPMLTCSIQSALEAHLSVDELIINLFK